MVKDMLKSVTRIALVALIAVELVGIFAIDALMFHPERVRETYDATWKGYVDIGTEGERIAAVALGPERGKKAILRCHGNAENMFETLGELRALAARGYTVAAVDYPGYGLSSGSPTEKGCYRNVHRLYDWLVKVRGFDPADIIVNGFSIGTGPAVELAATEKVGGLVLEAPFLSAARTVTKVRLLPIDPFSNATRVEKGIACPMLIIHGTADSVISFGQGKRLSEIARANAGGFPRRFVEVDGADHNEIAAALGTDDYLRLFTEF